MLDEQQYARENGYRRLGKSPVPVQIPLTEDEKIQHSEEQTHALTEIRNLEIDLKAYRKKIKDQIKIHKEVVEATRELLDQGYRIQDKDLPCFLDDERGIKHWVDPQTGEVVKSTAADPDDVWCII